MANFDFRTEVLDLSFQRPVLVDFWAPWCGPCRVLGPVLEQLAREQAGRWDLVKVNTEEEYELAEQFQIRSIPNVKLFYKGEVVGEFLGALPRTSIERWLDEHLPDDRKFALEALVAGLTAGGDDSSLERLVAFAEENPDMPEAALAAARQLVFRDPERAARLVGSIELGDKFYDAAEDIRQLTRLLAFNGTDGQPAAKKLGDACAALRRQDMEDAIQRLIEATIIDKSYQGDLPRKSAIALFRILGDQHPVTRQFRRRFDMALY